MTTPQVRLPQHTGEKTPRPKDGKSYLARAPYNFVPLPQQIVPAEGEPPDHDRYWANTGWIECALETRTPLYVRGMLTAEDFKASGDKEFYKLTPDEQERRAEFFSVNGRAVIPGSSLRGMIRALVEIAGFGKIQPVGGDQRFFYRAVAAPKDDPLGELYKGQMGKVKAGYVERRVVNGEERFFVHPAQMIDGSETFVKAREKDRYGNSAGVIDSALTYKPMDDRNYVPQYVPVSFTWKRTPKGRIIADYVSVPGKLAERGWMVCSGNMAESGKGRTRSQRRNHCIVAPKDPSRGAQVLPISTSTVSDYLASLTEFQQQKPPFSERYGCLQEGLPIFYLDDGKEVIAIGHSPNFRLPFVRRRANRASTALDCVPEWLRRETDLDLAEAMFGYVKSKDMPHGKQRAYAARVFVEDARALPDQGNLVEGSVITPKVLGSPKPSTFQHYLTQPDGAARDKLQLKHYASNTPGEAVLRGHKQYWHRPIKSREDFEWTGTDKEREDAKKQLTGIKPVRPGAKFAFRVRFENLSDVELGALFWSLDLPDGHAHKLGMGKPLGLGSVQVNVQSIHLTNRAQRYAKLLTGDGWATGEEQAKSIADYKTAFEQYVLQHIDTLERAGAQALADVPRVHELLCLLSFEGAPPYDVTRYLEIEHEQYGNEYKERPVLPLPSVVAGKKRAAVTSTATPDQARPARPPEAPTPSANWRTGAVEEMRPDKHYGRVRDMETNRVYRFDTSVIQGNYPAVRATVLFDLQGDTVKAIKRR